MFTTRTKVTTKNSFQERKTCTFIIPKKRSQRETQPSLSRKINKHEIQIFTLTSLRLSFTFHLKEKSIIKNTKYACNNVYKCVFTVKSFWYFKLILLQLIFCHKEPLLWLISELFCGSFDYFLPGELQVLVILWQTYNKKTSVVSVIPRY